MKINTQEVTEILKQKNKLIAWSLLVPALLLGIELSAIILSSNDAATVTYASASGPSDTPQVLGASIDLRGSAEAATTSTPPVINAPVLTDAEGGKISAKSFLVYDQDSGTVLASRNPSQKLAIASLTKLMTGFLAYKDLNFSQTIAVSKSGLTKISPIVNFVNGDTVATGDVFDAMLVGSCNDAAQVLARAIADQSGQDAVLLMNQEAKQLGMTDTNYSTPIGFDSATNYSTANDLRKLVEATQQLAAFTNLGKTTNVSFAGSSGREYRVAATNKLISAYPELQAIKTGYTAGAQGAMISKVVRSGHDIVIIVLGSQDREGDTVLLKNMVADKAIWE